MDGGAGSSSFTPGWASIAQSSLKTEVFPGSWVQHGRPPGYPGPLPAPWGRAAGMGLMAAGIERPSLGCPGKMCAVGLVRVPHPEMSLPCRPGLLPGSRHPLQSGAHQVSGQGMWVLPALVSPAPIAADPHQSCFLLIPLLDAWGVLVLGLLECSRSGMGSKGGAQRGLGWEQALPPLLCVSACTAPRAARASMGTSGETQARVTVT